MKLFLTIFFIFSFNLFAEAPNWVENPDDDCYYGYVCKVGTGETPRKAINNAKNNIIEVIDPFSDSVNKINSPEIEEFLNSIYEEINTEKSYGTNMRYFSFALIPIDTIKKKSNAFISKINGEINDLNDKTDGDSKLKIKNLNIIKNNLNSKLENLSSTNNSGKMPEYIVNKVNMERSNGQRRNN